MYSKGMGDVWIKSAFLLKQNLERFYFLSLFSRIKTIRKQIKTYAFTIFRRMFTFCIFSL